MLKVALTGGIATGKSYVLEQVRRRGIPCLDADVLAHGVTTNGTEATANIVERFGRDVLAADGSVNRAKMGRIVFADPAARRALEAIVHPAIYRAIATGFRAFELLDSAPLAVADVPLLYETGHEGEFDRVIVTACTVEQQLARLLDRGLSEVEARQRIAAQWPTVDKASRADFVIRTDGGLEETDAQVDEVLKALGSRRSGPPGHSPR